MGENARESHDSSTRTETSRPTRKIKGLPKVKVSSPKGSYHGNRARKQSKYPKKKQSRKKGQKGSRETNFTTLNTTNVRLVRDYFDTISPTLFDSLARTHPFGRNQLENTVPKHQFSFYREIQSPKVRSTHLILEPTIILLSHLTEQNCLQESGLCQEEVHNINQKT